MAHDLYEQCITLPSYTISLLIRGIDLTKKQNIEIVSPDTILLRNKLALYLDDISYSTYTTLT